MDKQQLFQQIGQEARRRVTDEFFGTLKQGANTQQSERISITFIADILRELELNFQRAGSQQSKDFRNIGDIGLDVEVKICKSTTVIFNDTCPNSNIYYIIFFLGNRTTRPQVLTLNGNEFIADSPWIQQYQAAIEDLKNRFCRGDNARNLPGSMKVYTRPNYSANISSFLQT